MRTHAVLALAALLGLRAANGAPPAAQTPVTTVRATVLEPQRIILKREKVPGRAVPWTVVTHLTRDDFEVRSDAAPCSIESFSAERGPLTVALLLDVTPSMRVPFDSLLESIQRVFIRSLNSADRVSVARIGAADPAFAPFQSDREELKRSVSAALSPPSGVPWARYVPKHSTDIAGSMTPNYLFGYGPSAIWDGVNAAVADLEGETNNRGIVLLTDGRSTGNVHSLSQVISGAVRAGIPVNVVGDVVAETLVQDVKTLARVRPQTYIQELADWTGGVYITLYGSEDEVLTPAPQSASPKAGVTLGKFPRSQAPRDRDNLVEWVGRSLAHAVDALRGSYLIGFSCGRPDGQAHALDVRVKRARLEVRAPRAYVAPLPMRESAR